MNKSHKLSKDDFIKIMGRATPLLAALKDDHSFSHAADHLGIQQSAISHRIRQIEEAAGFTLFERTTRKTSLTAYGQIVCNAASQSLTSLENAYDQLVNFQSHDAIRLSLSSSLAMKWALNHLPSAKDAGLEITLDVSDHAVDFATDAVDVAIRFGRGPYPGLHASLLCKADLIAVASPTYHQGDFDDIFQNPKTCFLCDRTGRMDDTDFHWDFYKRVQGTDFDTTENQISFDRADLMLQGAINAMGIALGRTLLIEKDIEHGFLTPIGKPVRLPSAYWLLTRPSFAQTERFQKLYDWLKSLMP